MTRNTQPARPGESDDDRHEPDLTEAEIRERVQAKAKELYVLRGGVQGRDWDDWFEAERIVRKLATRRLKGK